MGLEELIPQYGKNKEQLDIYKKACDKDNALIKKLMLEQNSESKECGGYTAKCTVQQRESMNDDILISLFTSVPAFVQIQEKLGIVKEKPYIDYDALESAIYNGNFTQNMLEDLNKAREVKEIVTLRVTKTKVKEKP